MPGSSAVPRPARCLRVECRDAHSGSRRRRILPELRSRDCAWARHVRCARHGGPRRRGPTHRESAAGTADGRVGRHRPDGRSPLSRWSEAAAPRLAARSDRRRPVGMVGADATGVGGLDRWPGPARTDDGPASPSAGGSSRTVGADDMEDAPGRSAVVALGEAFLLGEDLLVPGLPIPQLHPVDRPEHQDVAPPDRRTPGAGPGWPSVPVGRSPARARSRPTAGPGCGRCLLGGRPLQHALHLQLELVRRPQRQAPVLVLGQVAAVLEGRRGTSTAGSPFPCRRASARTCRRTVPLVIAPTTLPAVPGTRLFRIPPFHTTLRHFTPHPPLVNHSVTNRTQWTAARLGPAGHRHGAGDGRRNSAAADGAAPVGLRCERRTRMMRSERRCGARRDRARPGRRPPRAGRQGRAGEAGDGRSATVRSGQRADEAPTTPPDRSRPLAR